MVRLLSLLAPVCLVSSSFAADTSAIPQDYPLKSCPVSKHAYGSGGMVPYKVSHEGTDVWLCCKSCLKKFNQAPAKYAQAVKDAPKP